eukprot:6199821-Pleurochrysis_carterae.AAC.3
MPLTSQTHASQCRCPKLVPKQAATSPKHLSVKVTKTKLTVKLNRYKHAGAHAHASNHTIKKHCKYCFKVHPDARLIFSVAVTFHDNKSKHSCCTVKCLKVHGLKVTWNLEKAKPALLNMLFEL